MLWVPAQDQEAFLYNVNAISAVTGNDLKKKCIAKIKSTQRFWKGKRVNSSVCLGQNKIATAVILGKYPYITSQFQMFPTTQKRCKNLTSS